MIPTLPLAGDTVYVLVGNGRHRDGLLAANPRRDPPFHDPLQVAAEYAFSTKAAARDTYAAAAASIRRIGRRVSVRLVAATLPDGRYVNARSPGGLTVPIDARQQWGVSWANLGYAGVAIDLDLEIPPIDGGYQVVVFTTLAGPLRVTGEEAV